MLSFEKFLEIYEQCAVNGKSKFKERKKEYITQRREALANEDMKKYEGLIE